MSSRLLVSNFGFFELAEAIVMPDERMPIPREADRNDLVVDFLICLYCKCGVPELDSYVVENVSGGLKRLTTVPEYKKIKPEQVLEQIRLIREKIFKPSPFTLNRKGILDNENTKVLLGPFANAYQRNFCQDLIADLLAKYHDIDIFTDSFVSKGREYLLVDKKGYNSLKALENLGHFV